MFDTQVLLSCSNSAVKLVVFFVFFWVIFFFWAKQRQNSVFFLGGDLPHSDEVVVVACEQGLAVWGPGEREDLRGVTLDWLGTEFVNDVLGFQVPDLDHLAGSGAEPVSVRRESQRLDDVASLQGVEVLAFVQVPEHGLAVFAAGSAEGAVWGDGDSVQVAAVAQVVVLELAVGERPHLDDTVPAARNDDRVGGVWREPHARDPVLVAILGDGVLALAQSVPQLDRLVSGARDNLTVVGRKGDREDIAVVAVERVTDRGAGVQVPETEGAVP